MLVGGCAWSICGADKRNGSPQVDLYWLNGDLAILAGIYNELRTRRRRRVHVEVRLDPACRFVVPLRDTGLRVTEHGLDLGHGHADHDLVSLLLTDPFAELDWWHTRRKEQEQ